METFVTFALYVGGHLNLEYPNICCYFSGLSKNIEVELEGQDLSPLGKIFHLSGFQFCLFFFFNRMEIIMPSSWWWLEALNEKGCMS